MSTLKTDTLQNVTGSKSVPMSTVVDGSAKAWVNFNGQGTVAIRKAFNISSITDLGVGTYEANFATPLPDANYVAVGGCDGNAVGSVVMCKLLLTTKFSVQTTNSSANTDHTTVGIAVFN